MAKSFGRLGMSAPVRIVAAAGAGGRRRFLITAYTGEPLRLARYDLPVVIDCATLDATAQLLPAVLEHDASPGAIVGQVDSVRVKGAGLTPPVVAGGYFTPTALPGDAAAHVLARADAGFVWQASVGGDPARMERFEAGQVAQVNGREYPGPVLVARGVVLREISFTVLGADRMTSVVVARRSPAVGLAASQPRGGKIHMTAPRQARGTAPSIGAITGALLLRANVRLDSPAFRRPDAAQLGIPDWLRRDANSPIFARVADESHRLVANANADEICRWAIAHDGRAAPHGRLERIQAAFSGSALANVFTTNVNAVLLSSYAEAEDSTAGWVREAEVADFKTQERPRMAKTSGLQKLPRGGEADHLTRADVGESYRIARYAKQFQVDEQDIIDDSLGALADTPREMGQAAARLRPDLVYAIILANPTLAATGRALFNATDGNLDATAALAADKLRAAVAGMLLFQEGGVNLNLKPTHLLAPPSLAHLSRELVNSSQILIAGTAGAVTERGNLNALQADGITPVTDARLENGVIDPSSGTTYAGSGTSWFLACALAHTVEVGYLRGTGKAPRIRPFTLDRGRWGLGWDVSMDIGAKALDWRGLHKATA